MPKWSPAVYFLSGREMDSTQYQIQKPIYHAWAICESEVCVCEHMRKGNKKKGGNTVKGKRGNDNRIEPSPTPFPHFRHQ